MAGRRREHEGKRCREVGGRGRGKREKERNDGRFKQERGNENKRSRGGAQRGIRAESHRAREPSQRAREPETQRGRL